ncbi:MAG TPA: response regulator [Terriglobales bacterium]|nr:response regulator [Terriglobales bacterium]
MALPLRPTSTLDSQPSNARLRILIVDDHEIIRRGVRSLLEARPDCEICGEATDGKDAIEKVSKLKPDLVIMDVSMPALNGLEATRAIRKLVPETQVIILTQHESEEMMRQSFHAGARGYVVKSAIARDLVSALESLQHNELDFDKALPAKEKKVPHIDPQEILRRGAVLEQELRHSEERYRALVMASAQSVWRCDAKGNKIAHSEKWTSSDDSELETAAGEDWLQVIHPDDRERVLQAWQQAVSTGQPYFQEARRRCKDGSYRYQETRAVPLRNADGTVREWIGASVDITKRKQAEAELERRVEERTRDLIMAMAELRAEVQMRTQTEAVMRELSTKLLRMQDEERRRIARELHDSTGQTLTALKMALDAARTSVDCGDGSRDLLLEATALADQALTEIRTTSYLLHPPLLDEAGFSSAARWFVDGLVARSQLRVDLEIAPQIGRLPAEIELTLFRVLQEGLTNILRHSGSDRAQVIVQRSEGSVDLTIRDFGSGIPPEALKQTRIGKGVGLAGMRERVSELGGHLRLTSDGGTKVSVSIPLRNNPESVTEARASAHS